MRLRYFPRLSVEKQNDSAHEQDGRRRPRHSDNRQPRHPFQLVVVEKARLTHLITP